MVIIRKKGGGKMLYDKIRVLANKKKISIAELERTLGFSNGMISKWDVAIPNASNLYKVAKFFGVSVEDLMGDVGEDANKNEM